MSDAINLSPPPLPRDRPWKLGCFVVSCNSVSHIHSSNAEISSSRTTCEDLSRLGVALSGLEGSIGGPEGVLPSNTCS